MQRIPSHVYVLGFLAFTLLGLSQSAFGPSFSSFKHQFGIPLERAGDIVAAFSVGMTTGILGIGRLGQLKGLKVSLITAAALMTIGLALIALAPIWILAMAGATIMGFGYGGISYSFNMLYTSFGTGALVALNLLNAMFGVGSVLGPLVVNALIKQGHAFVFGAFALLALGLMLGMLRLSKQYGNIQPQDSQNKVAVGPYLPWAVLFAATLFIYLGNEVGAGSWISSDAQGRGWDLAVANQLTSGYWLALTIGRFLAAPISMRATPSQMLLGSGILALVATLLSNVTPYSYWLYGLALAPVYPSTLAWMSQKIPHVSTQVAPWVIAVGGMGITAMVPLAGWLHSVGWSISLILAIYSALLLAVIVINAVTKPTSPQASGS